MIMMIVFWLCSYDDYCDADDAAATYDVNDDGYDDDDVAADDDEKV